MKVGDVIVVKKGHNLASKVGKVKSISPLFNLLEVEEESGKIFYVEEGFAKKISNIPEKKEEMEWEIWIFQNEWNTEFWKTVSAKTEKTAQKRAIRMVLSEFGANKKFELI